MRAKSTRRACLLQLGAGSAAFLAAKSGLALDASIDDLQSNWRDLLADGIDLPDPTDELVRSDDEWRNLLGAEPYSVLREADTEPAGSSPLNDEHRPGLYVCYACKLPLFSSAMKFESGTGWPSFFTTIPNAFETKRDFVFLLPRTEYHCARCGGHHGHVFDDGPPPTGERWCNNGAALRFIPKITA